MKCHCGVAEATICGDCAFERELFARTHEHNETILEIAEVLSRVPDDDPIQRAETPQQYADAIRALLEDCKGGKGE